MRLIATGDVVLGPDYKLQCRVFMMSLGVIQNACLTLAL